MKIFKLTNNKELSVHDRPFFPSSHKIELVNSPEDCDYILLSSNPLHYKTQVKYYSKYNKKMVVWVNNDDPDFLDDSDGVNYKLIAQPSGKKVNHITVPLVMTDHILWHMNPKFIEKCRQQEKIYDYCFMGQMYGKRKNLADLNLPKYFFKPTGSIYVMEDEKKHKSIEEFLLELSRSKFAFAPRGIGSNSFRLYESLMVGTIPIATDVIEYPYETEIDWDSFAIRGKIENINNLIEKSKKIDYFSFRNKGINFWDKYVKLNNMHDRIIDKLL